MFEQHRSICSTYQTSTACSIQSVFSASHSRDISRLLGVGEVTQISTDL